MTNQKKAVATFCKVMAPHSSTLAWKIPWTEEPGRLQSMGLLRVGHDWATSLSLFTFIHWKRLWCWEELWAGGEGDDRGWDGWMASLTRWTWVWVNSGSWWWTGRPGVLRFMGSQSRTRLSDWTEATSLSLFTLMHWRRKLQPTPVFLPGVF